MQLCRGSSTGNSKALSPLIHLISFADKCIHKLDYFNWWLYIWFLFSSWSKAVLDLSHQSISWQWCSVCFLSFTSILPAPALVGENFSSAAFPSTNTRYCIEGNQGKSWSRQGTPTQVYDDAWNASLHLSHALQLWDFSQLKSVGKLTLAPGTSVSHELPKKMVKRTLQSMERSLGESSPTMNSPLAPHHAPGSQTGCYHQLTFSFPF